VSLRTTGYPEALFSASSKEVRHGATTKRCVFPPQLRFERAVATQKENLAPQLGSLSLRTVQRVMRDQQVVGLLVAKHFHSDECSFDNNRVNSIRKKVLHSLQPRNCLSIVTDEPNIVTDVRHRAA
jgi:hypothetical protein